MKGKLFAVLLAAVAFMVPSIRGQTVDLYTLHGFCGTSFATTTCPDNGSISPTTTLDTFGFTRSPDTNKGLVDPNIWLVFLIPDNVTVSTFTATQTSPSVTMTETLFSSSAWTTGNLEAFLGLTQTGGPTNPIGAWLPETQARDPGATGYFVYQANFGAVNFGSPDPTYTTTLSPPPGTVILAYITDTTGDAAGNITDSTANSAALIIDPIPEPGSIALLATVAGLVGLIARKRLR